MSWVLIVICFLLAISFLIITGAIIVFLKRISNAVESIAYSLQNNGVNLETKNDIAKVAMEVAKTKDRVKKLEVSENINKHKIDNLFKEIVTYNPINRGKNIR